MQAPSLSPPPPLGWLCVGQRRMRARSKLIQARAQSGRQSMKFECFVAAGFQRRAARAARCFSPRRLLGGPQKCIFIIIIRPSSGIIIGERHHSARFEWRLF